VTIQDSLRGELEGLAAAPAADLTHTTALAAREVARLWNWAENCIWAYFGFRVVCPVGDSE
jgi:hypothetical protein